MSRARILGGIGLLVVALTCLAFADTGAQPPEEIAGACGDWWCAKRNALPIGFAILSAGLGAALLGTGFISGPDADAEDGAAEERRGAGPVHEERPRLRRERRRG